MNFINCLLDMIDDSDQDFSEAIKDRARQMSGIETGELTCLDSD